ncbi:hypothetical protein B0T20DRAFT_137298 [Sordaria brevicollis]|uniref:Uncharacterized protein n=1 Tax=Sordaria brevicollis TaxID=83679 RepID=A0AAE0PLZ6_SORBR|nr:hypothetical protein B0T20DRAFT_137298 [Sordaria brevicollis]
MLIARARPISSPPSLTRSILGPLTTTFTPPPDCTQCYEVTSGNQIHGNTCRAYAEDCLGVQRASCLPGASKAISNVEQPWGFYSPGLACPSGWTTTGPTLSYGQPERGDGMGNILEVLEEGERAGFCCPSGFNLELTYPPSPTRLVAPMCYSRLEAGTYQAWGCINTAFEGEGDEGWMSTQYSAIVTNADFAKCLPRCPVFDPQLVVTATSMAPAVQLVWRDGDRMTVTVTSLGGGSESETVIGTGEGGGMAGRTTWTSSSKTSTVVSTLPRGTESSPPLPGPLTTESKSTSGLSPTGRTILLGVLTPILSLLVALGLWYFLRKRRQRHKQELRLSEEVTTYYEKKDQHPFTHPSPQPPPKIGATHDDDSRPESKAELDAINTARAKSAIHPSKHFSDPKVELDAVGTARAVDDNKRRTWERQELDGSVG